MKRVISFALLLMLAMPVAMATNERASGAFTHHRIKGNGTVAITGYDWEN